mmetsp:Transcript_30875/g.45662  ORF Transcript_30875/g.45662 Transcript_30875/m.45662 type:complete len:165 (+) Transcript_30875:352-846(+)
MMYRVSKCYHRCVELLELLFGAQEEKLYWAFHVSIYDCIGRGENERRNCFQVVREALCLVGLVFAGRKELVHIQWNCAPSIYLRCELQVAGGENETARLILLKSEERVIKRCYCYITFSHLAPNTVVVGEKSDQECNPHATISSSSVVLLILIWIPCQTSAKHS